MTAQMKRRSLYGRRWSIRSVKKVWFGVAIAVLLAFLPMALWSPSSANTTANIRFVSPAWVNDHVNDAGLRILDVRTNPLDYISGHIPGAVHIADGTFRGPNGRLPVQFWELDKLEYLFEQAGIADDSDIVIYSDDTSVLGSTQVAYLLERSGHSNAAVLDGGFKGYKEAGLPVTKEFPQYSPSNFTINDSSKTRVTLDEVKGLIGSSEVTFIDPRPAALFAGETDVFVRNGHIPGAKNIPWQSFTVGETNFHQLKPLTEIEALLNSRGIIPEDNIIVTCTTGREATLQYVVLKHLLGFPNVRVYEGSWTEYSSQPDLPVETGPDPELV